MSYKPRPRNTYLLPIILVIMALLWIVWPVFWGWFLGLLAALVALVILMSPFFVPALANKRSGKGFLSNISRATPRQLTEAEQVAMAAMRRAGRARKYAQIQLIDVGLLLYEGTTHPRITRKTDVPTTVTHIRPFIMLFQPFMPNSSGQGSIQLLMRDQEGKLRFVSDESYTLSAGRNFITPPTWLPLENEDASGTWSLEVTVGDTLLGVHEFEWLPVGGELRAQFNGDGEIDTRTRRWMELDFSGPLSLDDLLAEQETASIHQSQVRRSQEHA